MDGGDELLRKLIRWLQDINLLTLGLLGLFASIFHSFEAGIANAISNFKWLKNSIIYEK